MYLKDVIILLLSFLSMCTGTNGKHVNEDSAMYVVGDDGEIYRPNREFYRFGRAVLSKVSNEDDSTTGKGLLAELSSDSTALPLTSDDMSRERKQFYRFGKNQQSSSNKQFIIFDRSSQQNPKTSGLYESEEPLYRKKRSLDVKNQQARCFHRTVQSDDLLHLSDKETKTETNENAKRQETGKTADGIVESFKDVRNLDGKHVLDERFVIHNKRFMRFGRDNDGHKFSNKRFIDLGKSLGSDRDLHKKFMRFGKRFMRFGRGNERDENIKKRFMRFGKRVDSDNFEDKKFMSLGKRFMRFGKRFMRFGRKDNSNDDELMRFDKNHDEIDEV